MNWYAIVKTVHILAMTAWMAGMFYLPRLFVYHASASKHSAEFTTFKVMERRLLKAIMNPAMILTWICGILLIMITGYGMPQNPANWLMAKLILVLAMSGLHGYFAATVRRFAQDQNRRGPGFYKFINELVTVFFIGIVVLVVMKPF